MKLDKLIKDIYQNTSSLPLMDVKKICNHSSKATQGSLLIAVKGFAKDGHDYINDAIEKGASAIISDSEVLNTISVPNIKVKD